MTPQAGALELIRHLLDERGCAYRELQHAPTRTSEESAAARGEPLSVGGKALLLKVDEEFALFVLPADRKLDSAAVRRALGAKKARFATTVELAERAGLVPGCVPPFGQPILPFPLYADPACAENERIAFNAGSLERSIVMSARDWVELAQPILLRVAKPAEESS